MPLTVWRGDGDGHVHVGSVFWPLAPGGGARVGVPPSTYPDVSVLESHRCTATKKQTGTCVWYGATQIKLSPPTDSGFTGLRWRWDATMWLQLIFSWPINLSWIYWSGMIFKLTKEFIQQQQLKIQSIRLKLAEVQLSPSQPMSKGGSLVPRLAFAMTSDASADGEEVENKVQEFLINNASHRNRVKICCSTHPQVYLVWQPGTKTSTRFILNSSFPLMF